MLKFKRIIAYTIDMIFLCFLSALIINSPILNFNTDDVDRYREAVTSKMSNINYDEYFQQKDAYSYLKDYAGQEYYDLIKSQVYEFALYLGIYFLYFVVFAFFNQGRTLGCVFLKLKVVNEKNTKPGIISLFVRSLLLGSQLLFINPIFTLFAIILPRVLSVNTAFLPIFTIFGITLIIELAALCIFLFNKDNMSLQDYLAKTKVLEYKR
ncbi:MAG: RDD family protein [Bacilli bacterium]|nr:RDD family protein [Bacilli bacterium]